jgi:two-component system, response regulator PdtaR
MDARPANRHDIVLVVEDEPFTRWMAADILSSAGFVVLEAGSAGEALPILEAHEDVRVVFTDVEMPGPFDGLELARRVGERWPSIGVVITSGRPLYKEKVPETHTFLAKPYTGPALVRQIEDITQETAEARFELSNSGVACMCREREA